MSRPVAPQPGSHGGDGARLAAALGVAPEQVLDLSVNLNPYAPDVSALIVRHADAVHRYPDPTEAHDALARALGVDAAQVVLTNGGAEAIALVAAERPVGSVEDPEFSLYARHLHALDAHAPRWRSNPHNPTGRLAGPDERADVWDEAFYPLASGRWTRGDDGVVIVGSLTKVFACPGLRAGYVLAPDADLATRLRDRQPQWSVNALACAVLPTLLAEADLEKWSRSIADRRGELVGVLSDGGLVAEPSDAPYVLVPHAPGAREHLARSGILVRDTASFGITDGIRIAVPDEYGLQRLADALSAWRR
jgi:histidinol-phosphate/aromatic aminotransferase/cobyric acid decarboxylase-like protein